MFFIDPSSKDIGRSCSSAPYYFTPSVRAGIGIEEEDFMLSPNSNSENFSLSGLNRTIRVTGIDSLDQIIPLISPYKKFLQTVGIAASPIELFRISEQLGQHGVTRITGLGSMTAPEAGWHHDGRFNLLDLIKF